MENKIKGFSIREATSFFLSNDAALNGFSYDFLLVDAATIIRDRDNDRVALMISVKPNGTGRRLAPGCAFLRTVDTVADGITHKMSKRLRERVEDTFVQISILATHKQLHV